jgi:hypothetical protein
MLLKQNVMIFRLSRSHWTNSESCFNFNITICLSRSHWTNSESPDSVFVGVLVVAAHACDNVITAQPQVQVLKSDFNILKVF